MWNVYNLSHKHHVEEANYNLYVNGINHADRVMTSHDFVYLLEGGWEIYQNGIKYELYPDNLLILQANQHHYGKTPCLPNTKTMFLHVSSEHGDLFMTDKFGNESIIDNNIYLPVMTDCSKNKKVKELFKEIMAERWMLTKHSDVRISALFDLLLCEISISNISEKADYINFIHNTLSVIRNNPNIFYTVGELANQLNVSEKTLQNAIKKHTGLTVHKYQLEKKLEAVALQLQLQPDIKIKELSLNLGFYDEFHLSKLFKSKYNRSIRDYRNAIRSNDINNCK